MKLLASAFGLASVVSTSLASPTESIASQDARITYDGHRVYRIDASTQKDIESVKAKFAHLPTLQSRDSFEVVVPPSEFHTVEDLGLDIQILSGDIGAQIRAEAVQPTYKRELSKKGELPDLSWFDGYHAYEDHLTYWDDLQAAFPNNSEKINLGQSYEGRDLYALHLWGDEGNSEEKPIIYWHGTVHAREWITTMVVEYLTYQLIDGYTSGDANVTSFLNYYDFWIVPFHNPDGFKYTQTTNRLWRKSRQPRSNTTCIGTDLNRNWDYTWYLDPEGGGSVSNDPCSETFKGLGPGDTPENVVLSALSKKLAATGQGIRSYIDWHSYSQLILTPWGWSCAPEDLPATLPRMREVGEGVAKAILAVDGKEFIVGPACEVLYSSTGTGRDYHHGVLAANHSWSLELRPTSSGGGGFILPPEQIWPSVREQWAGQLWMLAEIQND
ncbi:unnamed protein product [Clonostachys rosea]|uniref:Peptidase M14 domain-containing protein n=1 Tax=Bionectria ochroleuca TaxID=29856 RepID=A0ABY6UF29_BIOOC|nr:unnamed protein product [Clonostachys rosea]